jgi:hypothetical protein
MNGAALDVPAWMAAGTVGSEAYCLECHDGTPAQPFSAGGDNTNTPDINTPWGDTYNHSANATCSDCHGDGAGNNSYHGGSTAGLMLDASQYATCTAICHGAGGSATVEMPTELSGTGGKHPIDGPVTPLSNVIADNMFVNGWTVNSVATCADCHGTNGGGPRGPHGSSYEFILKGMDKTIVTDGTPSNNSAPDYQYINENLCVNCHNASVYGFGSFDYTGFSVPSNATRGAISHYDDGNPFRTNCGNASGDGGNDGSLQQIGCTNCHAGAGRNYGAHSSSYGTADSAAKWTAQGAGFMNGNSWSQAPDNSNGCYSTSSGGWSTCNRQPHD